MDSGFPAASKCEGMVKQFLTIEVLNRFPVSVQLIERLEGELAVGDGNDSAPGVTTFRVSTRERTFVDEVVYKGWSIKLADWLHLSNPDDPSRPIIAQVFKCVVSDEM